MSPFLARLRQLVGTELLVLPAVAVLPWDDRGRVLLVRQADNGRWATIGGAVEPDEDPLAAAHREAQEEASVVLGDLRLRTVLGGPEYRITYPNGDQTSYVSIVFDAKVAGGEPAPDHEETTEARWFGLDDLASAELNSFARALLTDAGVLTA